ncbi:site-specific integrase [Cyclobacterium sediminis]
MGLSRVRMSPFFHTKKIGHMRASVLCRIRSDRPNKNGLAPVYLQVIINSKRTTIPLGVSWDLDFFDRKSGLFLERKRNDQEALDYNMLVKKEVSKINEIFMYYRHSDFELTIEQFLKEFARYGAKKNFLDWAELEIEERFSLNKIALQTRKNSLSNLKNIRKWKSEIKFSDIDYTFLENLQAWLKNVQGYKLNTVGAILKTVKVYVRAAHEAGIAVNIDSVAKFSLPSGKSRVVFLTVEEMERLNRYYESDEIKPSEKRVLRQFLFSCKTGLRFSDIERVTWREIEGDVLDFEPYKTRNIEKRVRILLVDDAFDLIENEKGKLFNTMAMQPTNRVLKDIALKCRIRKNLTTHVARHTFATDFLRRGGKVQNLQDLLGHSKITTTMIYGHTEEKETFEQMRLMQG